MAKERENPFLASRRVWNDHVERLVASRLAWQLTSLASLAVALGAVAGLAHVAGQSRFMPYVVEVDRAGHVEAVKRAARMPAASREQKEKAAAEFIIGARRVSTDLVALKADVDGAFALLSKNDPARNKLLAHLQENHPEVRAKTVTVEPDILSVVPESDDTWLIDWVERVYDRAGNRTAELQMRAWVQLYQSDPGKTPRKAFLANPLSIYVRDFNWAERK